MDKIEKFLMREGQGIFDTYDNLSALGLIYKIIEKLNTVVDETNTYTEIVKTLRTWFQKIDVTPEVISKLDQMSTDGTLANIINQQIFGNIQTEINTKANKKETQDYINSLQFQIGTKAEQSNLNIQNAKISNVESLLDSKATKAALDVERQRINNISANAGDTSANTELIDIRVGIDNQTYTTAGESVRTQFNKLNELVKASVGGLNNLNKSLEKLYYKNSISINVPYTTGYGYVIRDGYAQMNAYSYMKCKELAVNEHSIHYLDTTVSNGFSGAIIVSSDMKVIANYEAYQTSTTIRNFPILIPKGGTKLLLNCNSTMGATVYKLSYREADGFYNKNAIRSINRLGYRGNGGSENTMYAFKQALNYGFNIILCDVQFTSDNVPVSIHDNTLNRTARNLNGTELVNTVNIADITYQATFNYDFGIRDGRSEVGIVRVEDIIRLCKFAGCELYLEYKSGSFNQWDELMKMVARYDMVEKTSICAGFNLLQRYSNLYPKVNLGLTNRLESANLEQLATIVSDTHRTFLFGWSGDAMTVNVTDDLISKGIEYEFGTIDNADELPPLLNGTHKYASGLLTNTLFAGDVMRKYFIEN